MKTVTNYAEKKAKQFLNLLQGYTKGIRFTAILILLLLGVTDVWAWCGNSFIIVNDTWCTGSNSYVHTGGKFDGKDLGTLTTLKLGGELQVYPSSNTAASLCYKIDSGSEKSISLPKTGNDGNNSKHSGSGTVDLSTLSGGQHTIAVWFKHGSDYDSNNSANYKATFIIDPIVTFKANGGTGSDKTQRVTYNTSTALDANSFTREGYDFAKWNTKTDGTGTPYTDKQKVTLKANTTLYAQWTEKTYSLTFKHDGNGTIKVGDVTINSGSTATVNHITTKTLVATPNTGYDFSGWTLSGSNTSAVTIGSTNTASTTIKATNTGATVTANFTPKTYTITYKDQNNATFSGTHAPGYPTQHTYGTATTLSTATKTGYTFEGWYKEAACTNNVTSLGATAYTSNITLYAKWTPKTYTITLDANEGESNGSATATYNSSDVTNITHPIRTDHRCNGYYTAATDGTLVLNTDGTLVTNVSGYTDANGNWIKDDNVTLYAQWTYDVTEYTVTFGVEEGSSYGSLSAYNNTTSATITSPMAVRSGHSITFTATPETHYEVEGWYTDAACTSGKHNAGQNTYTTTISGETNAMTTTVFPFSTRLFKTPINFLTSWK